MILNFLLVFFASVILVLGILFLVFADTDFLAKIIV